MRPEDELSGVICKECYTLISELIDFAEHVNKVQAIFEVLRHSEPNKMLDVETLRQQYALRDGDWTHIIKPVSDIENNVVNQADISIPIELYIPKQELMEFGEEMQVDQENPLNNCEESTVNHLPIEEILVSECNAKSKSPIIPNKRPRGRPRKYRKVKRNNVGPQKNCQKINKEKTPAFDPNDKELPNDSAHEIPSKPPTPEPEPEPEPLPDSSNSDNDDVDLDSTKRRNLECKWCGKIYKNPTSYKKHLRIACRKVDHRKKVGKNKFCKICNKNFSSVAAFRLHMEGIHYNTRPFVCDHCGKQLKSLTALREHKLVHTEDRPFFCTVCPAAFKNKARLRVHKQTHEDPKYGCNICGKMLQTRRTWRMHKLVHTDERRFKCDVCGALFKRSKSLKTHLLIHAGMRPYVCKYCGRTFSCNANCRSHMMKKHPNELMAEEDADFITRLSVPTLSELRIM